MGTKASVTAADIIGLDGNRHCFMQPLRSCNMKISVVSQCRILLNPSIYCPISLVQGTLENTWVSVFHLVQCSGRLPKT